MRVHVGVWLRKERALHLVMEERDVVRLVSQYLHEHGFLQTLRELEMERSVYAVLLLLCVCEIERE